MYLSIIIDHTTLVMKLQSHTSLHNMEFVSNVSIQYIKFEKFLDYLVPFPARILTEIHFGKFLHTFQHVHLHLVTPQDTSWAQFLEVLSGKK